MNIFKGFRWNQGWDLSSSCLGEMRVNLCSCDVISAAPDDKGQGRGAMTDTCVLPVHQPLIAHTFIPM